MSKIVVLTSNSLMDVEIQLFPFVANSLISNVQSKQKKPTFAMK